MSQNKSLNAILIHQRSKLKDVETVVKRASLEMQLRWDEGPFFCDSSPIESKNLPMHGFIEGLQIGSIPGDVWLIIFGFCDVKSHIACEISCKQMYTIGYLPLSWSPNIHLKGIADHQICSRFGAMRAITSLAVCHSPVTDSTLHVLQTMSIKSFSLDNCYGVFGCFRPSISQLSLTLEHLKLDYCPGVNDNALKTLQYFGKLQSLSLNFDKQITDEGLRHLSALHNLCSLDLTHTRVSEVGLALLSGLPLRELVLNECSRMSSLQPLLLMPSLTHLELADCKNLSDDSLFEVLCHLSALKKLDLRSTNIKNRTLAALPPKLISLSLAECRFVSSAGLQTLERIDSLEVLNLASLHIIHLLERERLPKNQAQATMRSLPRTLSCLNLSNSEGLIDSDIAELATALPCLSSLSLRHMSMLSDKGLHALRDLPLTELDLTYCSLLSDDGLVCSLAKMPSLSYLNVSHCKLLTVRGLKELLVFGRLRTLDVSFCARLKSGDAMAELKSLSHGTRLIAGQ